MKSVILTANGVQDEEWIYPYYRLKELGTVTSVAIGRLDEYKGRTVVLGKHGVRLNVDETIDRLFSESPRQVRWFPDILIIPGGWEAPEQMRMNSAILEYVRACHQADVIIGAICHGPQVLISAGLTKGKVITGYKGIKDDIRNSGAEYVDAPVVRSGNIITSPHYENNHQFMQAVIEEYFLRHGVVH